MAIRNIRRQATNPGAYPGLPNSAPIYVDSDDNILKMIPAGSGTTEVQVIDASSTQTLTNKTLTSPVITGATLTPTGATALTAADSGKEVFLNASDGFAITLPAPTAGVRYRFTVAAAFANTNFTVVTAGGSNIIQGGATVAGADVPAADEDSINFVATAELKGDFVDVWSDGTSWFVNGRGTTAGSITFTVT